MTYAAASSRLSIGVINNDFDDSNATTVTIGPRHWKIVARISICKRGFINARKQRKQYGSPSLVLHPLAIKTCSQIFVSEQVAAKQYLRRVFRGQSVRHLHLWRRFLLALLMLDLWKSQRGGPQLDLGKP